MGETGKQIYFEEKAEFQSWKSGATRFKAALEHRLSEIKQLRREVTVTAADRQTELIRWAMRLIPRERDGAEWHKEAEAVLHG